MIVILDNIIYSLQKWGGISVYWQKITKALQSKKDVDILTLKLKNPPISSLEKFDPKKELVYKSTPLLPERYGAVNYKFNQKHIFHSSYYRISNNTNSINILTVHDFTYETNVKGIKKYVHILQKSHALKKADGIICISEYTRNLMHELYPFTKFKKTKVIYNGVADSFDKKTKDDPYIEPEIIKNNDRREDYAIYIGDRKASYKNFRLSVRLIKLIGKKLYIVGGGNILKSEKEILKDIDYHHFGFIEEKRLVKLYQEADFLLYPSESEGFGIPIIEAQKCGCVVISTNKTCIPEISGNAALLVSETNLEELYEATQKLQNEELKQYLILKGYQNSVRFDWKKTQKETIEFYKEILKSSSK